MNTREQIQARRIQQLERRTAWLEDVVRALLRDLEFTESVGAAMAFDIGLDDGPYTEKYQSRWDEAIKALEEAKT